jgi:protein subunit release factor B
MRDQLVVLRLELAAAAEGADGDTAELRVVPVGSAAPWADRLLAMYKQWAERTGRTSQQVGANGIEITGAATLDLLRGECGLHRHVRPDRAEELARVLIEGIEPPDTNDGRVVRVYEEGKRRLVRDPITGARASHLTSVLDNGHIDAFLIASLRHRATAETKTN